MNEKSPPLKIPQVTRKGYVEVYPGMVFDYSYPYSKLRRGRLQDNGMVCPTLTATHGCLLFLEKVVVEGVIYRGVNPSGSKANGVLHQPDNKSSQ